MPPTTDNPDEIFDLIDNADHVIGHVRRGDAHRNPALLHRSVQVLVFDDAGRILLQRRSATKDLFPGYYCASASGHVISGDDYAETARREIEEELGVSLDVRFIEKVVVASAFETEMTALFVARSNGPFDFNKDETAGGAFFERADLRASEPRLALTPAAESALAAIERLAESGTLAQCLAGL